MTSRERLEELAKEGALRITDDFKKAQEFGSLYLEVFKEKICTTCPGVIQVKIDTLILKLKQTEMNPTTPQRYSLKKKGAIIQIFGTSTVITEKNCTDELVENVLKTHPQMINHFNVDESIGSTLEAAQDEEAIAKLAKQSKQKLQEQLTGLQVKFTTEDDRKRLAKLLHAATKAAAGTVVESLEDYQAQAKEAGYPEEEWTELSIEDLKSYLVGKKA